MRTVTIDFGSLEPLTDAALGYIGEHNETVIRAVPPAEMLEDTNIVSYKIAFGTGSAVIHSETVTRATVLVAGYAQSALWQQLTQGDYLEIQLEGYGSDGTLLAKTRVETGYFEPSVHGTDETAEYTAPTIAEIAANTAARHTHSNKAVLDKFSESQSGTPLYDGNGFVTEAELALKQDKLTAGANITITGATIAADIDNTREIRASGTTANYTAAELRDMAVAGLVITYGGSPIELYAYENNKFNFSFYDFAYPSGKARYYYGCTVDSSKVITLATPKYIPARINYKSADSNGDVVINAEDISASQGYTPATDLSIATKKYVDDNAGGSPDWSNIQNKPSTFPPSSHTHTKSEITDFPVIPDISGCEVTTNKVTTLTAQSTDTQYPSAKCVYDYVDALIGNADALLGSGVIS